MTNCDRWSYGFIGIVVLACLLVLSRIAESLDYDLSSKIIIEAVELGHAEWIVAHDGSVEFKWKECGK